MSEKWIIIAFGLFLFFPLSLIFWANIYVAVKDILTQGTEAQRAETGNTDSVHDGPVRASECARNGIAQKR